MTAHALVLAQSTDVLHQHARSFTWASWFLPRDSADGAALLYALCRLVDDLVDETPDRAEASLALAALEAEIRGEERPRPLVAAWQNSGMAHPEAMLALIGGVRTDLAHRPFPTDRELLRYCYGVAGTVGLAMGPVLGITDPQSHAHAIDLGIAMQLTNICRDVKEDAAMGRVYLPAARLEAAGTSSAALLEGRASREAVAKVVADLLDLAEVYYASADAGMRWIPLRSRVAIAVASRIYGAIGRRLRRRGADALAGRTVVPWTGKALAALVALFSLPRLALGGPTHDPSLHQHLDGLPGCNV